MTTDQVQDLFNMLGDITELLRLSLVAWAALLGWAIVHKLTKGGVWTGTRGPRR